MAASMTITPASGSITAKETVCRINVVDADSNRTSGAAFEYYLLLDAPAGTDDGQSYLFNVDSDDGGHIFNNYVFPAAGSWTVRLRDNADDSDVATLAVTVS